MVYGDEDERKKTWLRDKYGDYKEWAQTASIFLVIIGIILFLSILVIGVTAISDKYEVRAFNSIHGTNYTWGEWFWAETTIKDYHLGTVENKNYEVDLIIKDEKKNILE